MRFGLGMNSDHTLEQVGQQFSVTRSLSALLTRNAF
jgi:DNA-directed RNA polymerase sigma subunit (sigma70/sigma32)